MVILGVAAEFFIETALSGSELKNEQCLNGCESMIGWPQRPCGRREQNKMRVGWHANEDVSAKAAESAFPKQEGTARRGSLSRKHRTF
jgi:hypothetical protein